MIDQINPYLANVFLIMHYEYFIYSENISPQNSRPEIGGPESEIAGF
jgi:hypothetical protein